MSGTCLDPAECGIEYEACDNCFRPTCECELDWNCGLHRDQMYTAIERLNDEWASRQDNR